MKRLLICIAAFSAVAGVWAMSGNPPVRARKSSDAISVFLTGNEFGQMKPCGCASGQLGGLDRRAAVLGRAEASRRLVVDTGNFVDADAPQDLIKFNIIGQSLVLLDYDLAVFTPRDVEMAEEQGLLEIFREAFEVIAAPGLGRDLPGTFRKDFDLNGRTVSVVVEAAVQPAATEAASPRDRRVVRIVVLDECGDPAKDAAAAAGEIDCVICPPRSDEPIVLSERPHDPLVISLGRFGKYVGVLRILDGGEDSGLNLPGGATVARRDRPDGLSLVFSAEEVAEDLPPAESIERLYGFYQQLVKEARLLEDYPRGVLDGDLRYAGSKSCRPCHGYEYGKWSTKAHAKAYSTLQRAGSDYDPECVVCHVVGMDYESGFITQELTPDLTDVGCENCHGPGSRHIESGGSTPPGRPRSGCIDCHTPDHSHYFGNEQAYYEKIIHWKEPESTDNCLSEENGDETG
jgi:hypothetical protein